MSLAPDLFRTTADIASIRLEANAFARSLDLDTHLGWDELDEHLQSVGLDGEAPDDYVSAKLADFLAPVSDSVEEVQGALRLPTAIATQVAAQVRRTRDTQRLPQRPVSLPASRRTLEHVRDTMLPSDLQFLPGTALEPGADKDYGEIAPETVARLDTFSNERLQTFAALSVVIATSRRPFERRAPQLAHHQRREDLFLSTRENPFDEDAVGRVYDAYYVRRDLFPEDSDYLREATCRGLFIDRAACLSHAAARPDLREALLPALPALPAKGSLYHERVVLASRELRLASVENRKFHSDVLADNFDDVLYACRVRESQTRLMRLNCDKMRKLMLARDADGLFELGDAQAFSYRERVVSPRGRRLDCTQTVRMMSQRASSLKAGASAKDIVFSFTRVDADDKRRHEPWFVPLFAAGVFLRPAAVPVRLRDRRRKLVRDFDMPDRCDKPAGLVMDLGAEAAEIMAIGLEQGLTIIPVDALAHGMLMTYVMVRVMALTMCRIGEALQILHDKAGWFVESVRGRAVAMFKAIPKMWDDHDNYVIDDRTVRLMGRLAAMRKAREGGPLQRTPGSDCLAEHKRQDAVHVFAFRDVDMREKHLNYLFRLLTAGLGQFTSHDIRHAAANRANVELIAIEHIKEMLRQRGDGTAEAEKYCRPTPAQLQEAINRHADVVLGAMDGLTQRMAA